MNTAADFPFLPFTEAIESLKKRGHNLTPTAHWAELWQSAHGTAFTVARSAGYDILGDIHAALLKAEAQGLPFRDFAKELTPLLQAKGWWGRTEDGVQLGSPRRLRTIYNVNMRASAARGNWERQQRLKNERPFLRYVCLLDGKTRPLHKSWHGTVLHIDDPWWHTHYPPNGWECRCGTEDLSKDDLDRFDYKLSPKAPDDGYTDWKHPVTGEIRQVPSGIDPGFDYHVGASAPSQPAQAAKVAMEKIAALPPPLGAAAVQDMAPLLPPMELLPTGVAPQTLRQVVAKGLNAWMENPQGNFPLAIIPASDAAIIGSTACVAKISPETLAKQLNHHPELSAEDYALVQDAVDSGAKYQQDGKNIAYVLNKGGGVVAIVKATRVGDELFVTSVRRLSRKMKKGKEELTRLKRGKR